MDVYRSQDILRRPHLREFVYPQPSLFVDISDFCVQLIAHGRPGMYLVSEVLENSVDGVYKSDSACLQPLDAQWAPMRLQVNVKFYRIDVGSD